MHSTAGSKEPSQRYVMVLMDVFPYGWWEKGRPRGFLVDVAKRIRQKSGVDYEIVLQPFGRNLKSLEVGKADFSIFYSYPDTISGYRSIGNVTCTRLVAVPMANSGIETVSDLNGKSVLFPPGGYFDRHYVQHMNIDPIPVSSAESILELASRGRADAFIVSDQLMEAYQTNVSASHRMPDDFWAKLGNPLELVEANIAFVVSDRSPLGKHTDRISATIREMQKTGEFLELAEKYFHSVQSSCLHEANKKSPH
ncbi:substrate-binding periplasmic protein [Emcibacter sp.]|uniref:substrate-binding periplasmic protein n=1 Tax=Emcibacter sp. TaxID=1979954 RepID=UPI003A904D93